MTCLSIRCSVTIAFLVNPDTSASSVFQNLRIKMQLKYYFFCFVFYTKGYPLRSCYFDQYFCYDLNKPVEGKLHLQTDTCDSWARLLRPGIMAPVCITTTTQQILQIHLTIFTKKFTHLLIRCMKLVHDNDILSHTRRQE